MSKLVPPMTGFTATAPSAGVTSVISTTCSSTGGMRAPVPCAPTCKRRVYVKTYAYELVAIMMPEV